MESTAAIRVRIAVRCGRILGRWAKITQSRFTIRHPAATTRSKLARIGVGKKFADIAQSGRSKQGVGDGVQEHIGIAVAQRLPIMGDGDSPQHKAGPRPQPMGVVP